MSNALLVRTAARWSISRDVAIEVLARDLRCIYCRRDFDLAGPRAGAPSWEHIVNDLSAVNATNIALCCISCNASKGRKDLGTWLKSNYCIDREISSISIAPIAAQTLGVGA